MIEMKSYNATVDFDDQNTKKHFLMFNLALRVKLISLFCGVCVRLKRVFVQDRLPPA